MDPENPIVKLCAQGIGAETAGDMTKARELFDQAWSAASDDWERCVAAHYVARHQDTPEMTLQWNEACLRFADAAGGERVAGFYPSLYLNIGHSREMLGEIDLAAAAYRKAEGCLGTLPPGPYADMVRDGVARGLERVRRGPRRP